MTSGKQSLRYRISIATSEAELAALIKEGEGFKFAADATRRRWAKQAKLRLREIADRDDAVRTGTIRAAQIAQNKAEEIVDESRQ